MTSYVQTSSFQNAASYLSSASSLSKVSSVVKLELYGLFKYITVARIPTTSRPSIFDMTGRAKWDAWSAADKKYEKEQDAEIRYLEIARSLGWTEGTAPTAKPQTQEEEEIDWDDGVPAKSGTGGGGMGLSVSSMAPPKTEIDKSIHGLAVSNDVPGLTTLLELSPDTDLNALDEFGYAPLHLACDRGNIEIVRLLLSKGANRTVKDPDGFTLQELAQEAGHKEIESILASSS
ncbi:hypothetical protein BDQ12DRAFT_432381 [Crucibulum laeve]|uniref:ACB domain-containing protein n=1 Tax=Crucibulum laeve TaxID=68775 RepID=A0A5C3MJA1_9AGAR|nr:hypothetical protein BDQ12DRAFT_432381 [Crucibulum laeve]